MSQNNFSRRSDAEVVQSIQVVLDALNGPDGAQYGIPNTTKTGLLTSQTQLTSSVNTALAARAAAKAATQAKEAKRSAALDQLVYVANQIYNNPTITDALLAAAGLAVRDKTRTPVTPVIPQDLVAYAFENGSVNLKWARGGNPKGVMFSVEARGSTGGWSIVGQTTRTSIQLEGYTPGVFAAFRVRALTSIASSLASNTAVIYSNGQEAALEIAA
jgi:hypothetical protein